MLMGLEVQDVFTPTFSKSWGLGFYLVVGWYINCLMMDSLQFIRELQNQLGIPSSSKWTSGIIFFFKSIT
jgi:hypothetical protein